MSSRPVPDWIVVAFLFVSLAGFADSTYLAAAHYLGAPLSCSVFTDCEKVTTSRYAVIAGIPLGVFGAMYYMAVFLLTIAYIDTRRTAVLAAAVGITAFGFLASIVFVCLQLFVIRAICPYCMASALSSTILFVIGLRILKVFRASL